MIKKFECRNCHKQFEADDSQKVVCPHCQSDNIDIFKKKLPGYVWPLFGVGLAVCVSFGVYKKCSGNQPQNDNDPVIEDSEQKDTTQVDTTGANVVIIKEDEFVKETGLSLPPTLQAENLEFVEGEGYKFDVILSNPPKSSYKYVLLDAFDDAVIVATCENGHFKGVPFSEAEGGSFRAVIVDDAGKHLCDPMPVPGFIEVNPPKQKMTADQLQQLIKSKDESLMGVGESDYLAPEIALTFKGLPRDAENIPTTLAEVVFDKLEMGIWNSVKVIDLKYDEYNRINAITFKVSAN